MEYMALHLKGEIAIIFMKKDYKSKNSGCITEMREGVKNWSWKPTQLTPNHSVQSRGRLGSGLTYF
jgi:hypothetical protein